MQRGGRTCACTASCEEARTPCLARAVLVQPPVSEHPPGLLVCSAAPGPPAPPPTTADGGPAAGAGWWGDPPRLATECYARAQPASAGRRNHCSRRLNPGKAVCVQDFPVLCSLPSFFAVVTGELFHVARALSMDPLDGQPVPRTRGESLQSSFTT